MVQRPEPWVQPGWAEVIRAERFRLACESSAIPLSFSVGAAAFQITGVSPWRAVRDSWQSHCTKETLMLKYLVTLGTTLQHRTHRHRSSQRAACRRSN